MKRTCVSSLADAAAFLCCAVLPAEAAAEAVCFRVAELGLPVFMVSKGLPVGEVAELAEGLAGPGLRAIPHATAVRQVHVGGWKLGSGFMARECPVRCFCCI